MAKIAYDPAVRKTFITAAIAARKEGKTWSQVFHLAKSLGYAGSHQGIIEILFATGKVKPGRRGRKPGKRSAS